MSVEFEEWVKIPDFVNYEVSTYGRVRNVQTNQEIRPSRSSAKGLKIGLYSDKVQYQRSLPKLVAEAFIEKPDYHSDTVVHISGDKLDNSIHNLMWRPLWFAQKWTIQMSQELDYYDIGPILEVTPIGTIIDSYEDVREAGMVNGVLFFDVYRSVHELFPCYPGNKHFTTELQLHRYPVPKQRP